MKNKSKSKDTILGNGFNMLNGKWLCMNFKEPDLFLKEHLMLIPIVYLYGLDMLKMKLKINSLIMREIFGKEQYLFYLELNKYGLSI